MLPLRRILSVSMPRFYSTSLSLYVLCWSTDLDFFRDQPILMVMLGTCAAYHTYLISLALPFLVVVKTPSSESKSNKDKFSTH